MVVTAPLATPADPTPAITRPMMNMAEECAAPHTADPTSKMTKKTRKVHYMMILSELTFVVTMLEPRYTLMENRL